MNKTEPNNRRKYDNIIKEIEYVNERISEYELKESKWQQDMVKTVVQIDKINQDYNDGLKKWRKEAGMTKKAFEKLLKLYIQNIRNTNIILITIP